MAPCIFCDLSDHPIVAENALAVSILDNYPVSTGHTLIIPRRHFDDVFDITPDEWLACMQLLLESRRNLSEADESITGFNMGVNAGASAGQTVPHCHIHLIPRRDGDVANPEGGVRGVIPDKQHYRKPAPLPELSAFTPAPALSPFAPRPADAE